MFARSRSTWNQKFTRFLSRTIRRECPNESIVIPTTSPMFSGRSKIWQMINPNLTALSVKLGQELKLSSWVGLDSIVMWMKWGLLLARSSTCWSNWTMTKRIWYSWRSLLSMKLEGPSRSPRILCAFHYLYKPKIEDSFLTLVADMIWSLHERLKEWTWRKEFVIPSCSILRTIQLLPKQKPKLTWEPLTKSHKPMSLMTLHQWCLLGNDAWRKGTPSCGLLVRCHSWSQRMGNVLIWRFTTTSPTLILEHMNALHMNVNKHRRFMINLNISKRVSTTSMT